MQKLVSAFGVAVVIAGASALLFAQGQGQVRAPILIPDSSVEQPGDRGVAAHTNHLIRITPDAGSGSPTGETPASIASVYGLTGGDAPAGAGVIVIVDAFDYPTAVNDFNVFSATFGLPQETGDGSHFQVVYASGSKPRANCGWAQEAALDIEWAHAMAPNAKIVLVEAASNSFANLFAAVDVASAIAGARQVSMSWGGSEFSGEAGNDTHFPSFNNIVYLASSGDTGGATIYPGVSPLVVSAGGTRINRDAFHNFLSETGWSGSGGGPSKYEARPAYQSVIANLTATRGVPDYSFDADPNTGVSVYDSTMCQGARGWLVFGGTSVAAPSLAGIVNSAGSNTDTTTELNLLYSSVSNGGALSTPYFRDILSGTAGSFSAKAGWDFVTGIGSTNGLAGK
jgi:kumamolisin